MSSVFSFSDDENAMMPIQAVQSAQVLAEIESTMKSEEVGEGKAFEDGSLFIRYANFCIRLMPDGTFMGQRIVPAPVEIPQRCAQ